MKPLDHSAAETEWNGFILLHDGGCTYEEKARRVEKMGA